MKRLLLVVLVSAATGCVGSCLDPRPDPPDPEVDAGPDGPAQWGENAVEIGTTPDGLTFKAMPADLELHPGAQGGFHVPISYRVLGRTEPDAVFEHKVRRVKDNVLVSRGTRSFDVAPDGGVWTPDYEITVFLCPTPVGITVQDEEVVFEVRATRMTSGALLGVGTARTTLRCPAGNSFCASICKG